MGEEPRMPVYFAIVHKDPDSDFGIEIPDFPGCFSAAETPGGIIANVTEAMNLWLTDQDEVPAASTIEMLIASRADDLAEGGIFVAIPFEPAGTACALSPSAPA